MSDLGPNLLDVNFLVALAWPNHVAHVQAVAWFLDNRASAFATCPMTEAGFIRISMNPLVVTDHTTASSASNLLTRYRTEYSHVFWPDDIDIAEALRFLNPLSGHRQITDAYLLALAISHKGRLVTFDSGIETIAPPSLRSSLVVVQF